MICTVVNNLQHEMTLATPTTPNRMKVSSIIGLLSPIVAVAMRGCMMQNDPLINSSYIRVVKVFFHNL